jgi:hypothetical protein
MLPLLQVYVCTVFLYSAESRNEVHDLFIEEHTRILQLIAIVQ